MKIATAWTTVPNVEQAVQTAFDNLSASLDGPPNLLIVYPSVGYSINAVVSALQNTAADIPVHGGTSCLGVMTADGFHSADGVGLGMLGLADPDGSYGVGAAEMGDDPRLAGRQAVEQAVQNAGREGELPALIWLTSAPGAEESVLRGIQDVVGESVPIAGGSSADNTVEGNWVQFTANSVHKNGVVVTVMYPSSGVHLAFHSGYWPTDHRGVATRAEGRTVYEIDGRPAAQVYNEWTGGVIQDFLSGGSILGVTTLHPLGRIVGAIGGLPYHKLAHPERVTPEGALTLFADVSTGDELVLMTGTRSSLVSRAGRVAQSALENGNISADRVAGALVVYCAGCMLTIQDRMNEVAAEINKVLAGAPFLGTFTFGEQGCFLGGENRHGNLMISVAVFEK
ncbi:MAG: hypothetical protein D6784_08995 [Chloroflexi bacterium]|nr:MAG: hypothetical protein D6784_08995 [Chloroflexota bacterium]